MKRKYLLLALCALLLVTGCKKVPKLENGQEVIVEINDKQFTADEFFDALKKEYGASVLVNMVDKYITEKELTDQMKEDAKKSAKAQYDAYNASYSSMWDSFLSYNGFNSGEEFLEQLEIVHQQNTVLENYVKSIIKDEEIQKYYDEDIYGEITARHILIQPEVKDTMTDAEKKKAEEDALNEAKQLIEQLKNSTDLENDFIKLAKEKSEDTGSASEGGLIENFTNDSGLVEEFWEGSLKLEVGKMTEEPVKTEFGYHIIYKVKQNEKPSLETVKDKVIDKLVDQMLSAENATYVYWAGLREKYNLNIHDDIIKDEYNAAMDQIKN